MCVSLTSLTGSNVLSIASTSADHGTRFESTKYWYAQLQFRRLGIGPNVRFFLADIENLPDALPLNEGGEEEIETDVEEENEIDEKGGMKFDIRVYSFKSKVQSRKEREKEEGRGETREGEEEEEKGSREKQNRRSRFIFSEARKSSCLEFSH